MLGGAADETLIEETAAALYTIVFNNQENRKAVAEIGVPALLILLSSTNTRILDCVTATVFGALMIFLYY